LILSDPIEPPRGDGKETELILRDKVHSTIYKNLKN